MTVLSIIDNLDKCPHLRAFLEEMHEATGATTEEGIAVIATFLLNGQMFPDRIMQELAALGYVQRKEGPN